MKLPRLLFAAVLFFPLLAPAAPDVNVVVDMTAAGRKIIHPTPEHPAYYLPVMRGYQQWGDPIAGEKPMSPDEVCHVVATELAAQGYRAIDEEHRTPSLIIDFSWGLIAPTEDFETQRNKNQREALVLGRTLTNVVQLETPGHEEFMESTKEPRYFVIVTAFDHAAWQKKHDHVILWKARMSIPISGVFFSDVVLPLVKAGGPQFGRETINHPKLVPVPEGRVEVGIPTVKTETEKPASAPAK